MQSVERFFSILKARNKEFYRDSGALGWTFLFPILIVVSFGYIFQLEDKTFYKLGYVGERPNLESDFIEWVSFSSLDLAHRKLTHHQIDLVVSHTSNGSTFLFNESSAQSKLACQIIKGLYLDSQFSDLNGDPQFVPYKGRIIGYVEWLFPGLLSLNVMWMALWGVGWVIVRQRKLGVLKRAKASPLRSFEYLLAQIVSRMIILVASGIIVFVLSHIIYPFQTVGSYGELLFVYTLGCFSLSSMGLVIAARITSEELASGLLNLLTFPMMFLSEIWFSLEGSPSWVLWLAKSLPLWHMTNGMRLIMNEGANLWELKTSLIILTIIGVFCTTLGSMLFKWNKE